MYTGNRSVVHRRKEGCTKEKEGFLLRKRTVVHRKKEGLYSGNRRVVHRKEAVHMSQEGCTQDRKQEGCT